MRQKNNLTQTDFAQILNVSFQAVSNWERGIAPPELENLMRIAAYFGILVDDLLRPRSEGFYLGVDGGGTKTEFVLISHEGHVVRRAVKGGSNPNDIGYTKSKALVLEGIKEFLVEFPSLRAIFLGISGISVSNYSKRLCEEIKKLYPQIRVQVKTDVANLFAADDTVDMALVSGTGSVVFVRHGEEYKRIGGWGYLLDNAGSAYDIGRDALCFALEEEDMCRTPSCITKKLRERLDTDTVWNSINKIYDEGKPYIAELAGVVFAAYREGSADAAQIIDNNAKALARRLNAGVQIYNIKPAAIANGGLFEHYPAIMKSYIEKYTDVNLIQSSLPPVYGACRSALKIDEKKTPDCFYENFKRSYGGIRK